MKTKILNFLMVHITIFYSTIAFSQTGIFFYTDSALLRNNIRIMNIRENPETNEIYLLGKAENEDFSNIEGFYFARIDKNGEKVFSKLSNENNLNYWTVIY